MNAGKAKRDDLVYPELSYEILGCFFDVWNNLGGGYKENTYQKAVAIRLKEKGLAVQEQAPTKLLYRGQEVGRFYFDFLIEEKVVVEIKARSYFSQKDIQQILSYLKTSGLKLGLLIHFTPDGVKYKRIVNII